MQPTDPHLPEPEHLRGGLAGFCRLPWYLGNPRGETYLNLIELEIDGLGAHANIVSDDVQDKRVHGPGCVQAGRL